jgi:hypothetical protein
LGDIGTIVGTIAAGETYFDRHADEYASVEECRQFVEDGE